MSKVIDFEKWGAPHYRANTIEVLKILQANMTLEEYRGFCKGNIIKYLMRDTKGETEEDVQKALHYTYLLYETYGGQNVT